MFRRRVMCTEEEFQLKGQENIFKKITEENLPNLKGMPIKVQKSKNHTENQIHWTKNQIPLGT